MKRVLILIGLLIASIAFNAWADLQADHAYKQNYQETNNNR